MLPELEPGRVDRETFSDLVNIIKSLPKLRPPSENPSVTDLLGLSEEELGSVWDRFQFSIAKRNVYSENSGDIKLLLDNMKTLPVVGRKY